MSHSAEDPWTRLARELGIEPGPAPQPEPAAAPVAEEPTEEAEPAQESSLLRGLVAGRGPTVPMGTWVVATDGAPASVGISHGVREKAMPRLRAAGVVAPARWKLVQDNARRGLVARIPSDEAPEEVLAWLMGAIDELCPVPLTGHWLAELHTP